MTGFEFPVLPEKFLFRAAIALCLLFAFNGIIVQLVQLPLHILKGDNEGFNAYFAARAMEGLPLYPRSPALLLNNYPPLSFYLVGLFGKIVGNYIIAGRILCFLSFFGIAGLIGYIVARQTGSQRLGLFSGLYFCATFSVFKGEQIGQNSPQLLAHFVMLGGFAVFWFSGGRFPRILAGAALMVAAGLIKHNIIALPAAVTVWLALTDRRQFRLWLAAVGLSLAVAGIALVVFWNHGALESILVSRPMSLLKSFYAILILREILPPLTMMLFLLLYPAGKSSARGSGILFGALYVAIALVVAFYLFAGVGIGSNVAFEVMISVVLALGFLLGALPDDRQRTAVIAALVLAQYVMIPLGIGAILNGSVKREAQNDGGDIAYVAAHRGDAICGNPTLCYWAGKDFVFDFFNLPVLYEMKKRDPEIFWNHLRHRDYAVIALDRQDPGGHPWFAQFHKVMDETYRLDRVSEDHAFYVPK